MPAKLQVLIAEAGRLWSRLPRGRQVGLAVLAGLGVAALVLYFSWSSSPPLTTAYANLDEKDSAQVVDYLKAQSIPYELAADGTTIRVPSDRVDEVRLSLAEQGLPQGSTVGFEIFDKTNFGATDFVQRINYQRSLEGELGRTINSLDAVESSRVHIVLPEDSLFSEQQQPTTASVVLKLRGGGRLTDGQVRGIAHLVSHAVEGLQEEQITIVDTDGNVLMDGSQLGSGFGASSTNLQLQHEYENNLGRDLQTLLDSVLGVGKSTARVRAELDFDSVSEESESYPTTADPAVRSEQSTEEKFDGQGTGLSFVPGVNSNVPGTDTQAETPQSTSTYEKNDTTTNYELPKTVTTTVRAPGAVKRLSVSVLLDESVPEEQLNSLTEAVSAAVGLDTERGDQIAISRIPFDSSFMDQTSTALAGESSTAKMLGYARLAIPLLALVGFFVFYRLMIRSLVKRREGWNMGGGYSVQELSATPLLEERSDEARRREVTVERVARIARQQPAAAAEIVQSWLGESN